ncbi:hypothetical protein [Tenacibaculum finnmarkense]|uniref:hypothetical protein n=1 Tax=Tenacibaculum finnmarkense TaxID=2781243 RepID=UPI001EFC1A25|nr:hypothetical protein [Tenacibaculum finnmarkense]MCG8795185.1 hypothetical protein [Tenacibaculum finnmarkense]MCG8797512.1 hypothetical protein [Tenacibaculum finnmarkense]
MKNLNDFGVQELSGKEIKETQGGIWPLIALWALGHMIYKEYQYNKYFYQFFKPVYLF